MCYAQIYHKKATFCKLCTWLAWQRGRNGSPLLKFTMRLWDASRLPVQDLKTALTVYCERNTLIFGSGSGIQILQKISMKTSTSSFGKTFTLAPLDCNVNWKHEPQARGFTYNSLSFLKSVNGSWNGLSLYFYMRCIDNQWSADEGFWMLEMSFSHVVGGPWGEYVFGLHTLQHLRLM